MNRSGVVSGTVWWVFCAAVVLLSSMVSSSCVPTNQVSAQSEQITSTPETGNIVVIVTGIDGTPLITNVIVRVTGSALSDGDDFGQLRLDACPIGQAIAAWAPSYQVAFIPCTDSTQYSVALQPLDNAAYDNTAYVWQSAYASCSQCHASGFNGGYNEFQEWGMDGHATVFTDRYFESMYRGTDISGVSGPQTQWIYKDDKFFRSVNVSAPEYKGPGFQLDYPGRAGNCAYCHAPAAISSALADADLTPLFLSAADSRREGVTCDVCHKVNNVILADNNYPFPDKPGILSLQFLRMDSFITGPFSNILSPVQNSIGHTRSKCANVFSSSDFCAACHYGKFGDTLIYASYKEWKESPYGKNPKKDGYRTCQDCHMSRLPGNNKIPLEKRSACSETAEGFQNFDHNMMDYGWDESLSRNVPRLIRGAAKIATSFEYNGAESNLLKVSLVVRNTSAGHKFPTDSPLRHLILVLDSRDQFGNILLQAGGSQIPIWGGINNSYMEGLGVKGYAGLPGKIFANVLIEEDINLWPSAAYWNETKPAQISNRDILSDNRLEPGGRDESEYFFTVPDDGEVRFRISLLYRFGFYDLMQQKRWVETGQRADIPVVVIECSGNVNSLDAIQCLQTDPKPD